MRTRKSFFVALLLVIGIAPGLPRFGVGMSRGLDETESSRGSPLPLYVESPPLRDSQTLNLPLLLPN